MTADFMEGSPLSALKSTRIGQLESLCGELVSALERVGEVGGIDAHGYASANSLANADDLASEHMQVVNKARKILP